MRRLLRIVAAVIALALALLLVLVASTVPARRGVVPVAGLSRAVRIETDRLGVPTIRASSVADALFGLGYAHARDRLWQMEFQRRIGSGRLAEILGPRLVPSDRFLRTVGFRRAAQASVPALSREFRGLLDAYLRGINARLASSRARPLEFRLLRIRPEPFDAADCLVWGKMMAWDLAGNATMEIRRSRLEAAFGRERASELFPRVPPSPTILLEAEWPSGRAGSSADPLPRSGVRVPDLLESEFERISALGSGGEAVGSNSWVLAGNRTTTGRPILANDPHLGLRTPSVWYLARVEAPGYSVVGATLPGLPGIVIGRNDRIAWGLTNLEPDVQDLYLETTAPGDPTRYLHDGEWKLFETRRETIRVRGNEDVSLEVRASVHGPIVTDVLEGAPALDRPAALRWTGLDPADRTAEALAGINRARNWPDFLAALTLVGSPAQSFAYADVEGHIGYAAAGRIPIRPREDGERPVSGEGADDWSGFLPFEALPRVLDPARGYVVTANNRIVPGSFADSLSLDWTEPYRARRITQLLLAGGPLGIPDIRRIQLDRVSGQALDLLPLLLRTRPADAASSDALTRLRRWDGEMAPESVPAAIYAAWYVELARMPEDELSASPPGRIRSRFLLNALSEDSLWCDDARTTVRESCADFQAIALRDAMRGLSRRLGPDPSDWRWERLHRARFPHPLFEALPLVRRAFSLAAGQGGDASTVNVGAYALDGTFDMRDGPSYRLIADLSRPEASLYVHTTGQSGNPFERGYRDLLPLWRRGDSFRISPGRSRRILELRPSRRQPG